MLVVDTSELKRPTQRKLHAAWQELHGRQVRATPGVAAELAPMAVDSIWRDGPSAAQRELESTEARLPARRRNELKQQIWWADMWRDPHSPYQVVKLTEAQERLAESIRTEIDPRCFPTTDPDDIPDLNDARIVTESLAIGAKMLLTSNLRSIDHIEVNRWTVEHGREWNLAAEPLLYDADRTFTDWTTEPAALERWIQSGFLACWPDRDDAAASDVIQHTAAGIEALRRGNGGKLPTAAARLLNGLEKHHDPIGLVERTREKFPSRTVETDRRHPSYPARGAGLPGAGTTTPARAALAASAAAT